MSQFFTSGGQSIRVSALASVLPMNIQDWFPLGLTGWISLQSKGLSRVFSQHHSSKASILRHLAFFIVQLSHPYMTTGKTIALTGQTLKLVMLSYHLILCRPLLLLLSVFPSNTVFSSELALRIRWPKYWSFTVRISPSSEYSGLISFRIWLVWSPCSPRDS